MNANAEPDRLLTADQTPQFGRATKSRLRPILKKDKGAGSNLRLGEDKKRKLLSYADIGPHNQAILLPR
ncbi:MAG: hypothetical protein M1816_007550 [Peltula sp. TS41687]|nr:MAG: hypothetical protein M1816_007550 [Peltula sp. TS41687]